MMSLQADKELPDVTEVGAPPETIPQKIEPVILELVFRDVPGRSPGEISQKLLTEESILIDAAGEILTSSNWRSYYRQRRKSAKLNLRLMGKEN